MLVVSQFNVKKPNDFATSVHDAHDSKDTEPRRQHPASVQRFHITCSSGRLSWELLLCDTKGDSFVAPNRKRLLLFQGGRVLEKEREKKNIYGFHRGG